MTSFLSRLHFSQCVSLPGVILSLLMLLQLPALADYTPPDQDPPRGGTGSSGVILAD